MDHTNDKTASPSTVDARVKKPYEAPALIEWGTLRDLTNAVGSTGAADGGRGSAKKTSL